MQHTEEHATTDLMTELAPGGSIRAAINLGNPVVAHRDASTGEARGLSVDVSNEIGRRSGLPVELHFHDTAAEVASRSDWDIAFLAVDPARAKTMHFSSPYAVIDGTYMVRSSSPLHGIEDVDQKELRVAVATGSAYALHLGRVGTRASLVAFPSAAAAVEGFLSGQADAAAGVRQLLESYARDRPELRVLQDAFMRIEHALAIPAGRPTAASWIENVLLELKASGFIRAALDRSGQAAVPVPPLR